MKSSETHEERSLALSTRADALLPLVDHLPIHALRLEMAKLGWVSTLEVASTGWGDERYGLTIRMRRWEWHGRRTCGDPHFMMSLRARELTSDSAQHAIRAVSTRAIIGLRDFPDSLPHWERGHLQADPMHDSLFSTPMDLYLRPEWPTEDIPTDCLPLADEDFGTLLEYFEEIGRRGWGISHELTFIFFNPDRRQHQRRWGQEIELTRCGEFGSHGSVLPYHHKVRTEGLLASTGCRLVDGALKEMDALELAYGSCDHLPSGMMTIAEYREQQSKNRAR